MATYGTFYGFEQKFGVSRLYKLYVTEGALCGAKIADRDYDGILGRTQPSTAALLLSGLGGIAGNAVVRKTAEAVKRKAEEKERQLDATAPGSPSFLSDDKANFSLGTSQVSSAIINLKLGTMQHGPNRYGSLELALADGSKRRFFLVGQRVPQEVVEVIKQMLPGLQVQA